MIKEDKFIIERFVDRSEMEKVIEIWLEASKRAHHFIDFRYWLDNAAAMREIYIPQSETWIYRGATHEIAGFISLVGNDLASIFVHTAFQNKGIGKRLMAKAKSLRDELYLTVYAQNLSAIQFYTRENFIIRESRIDPNTNEEEYVMSWRSS